MKFRAALLALIAGIVFLVAPAHAAKPHHAPAKAAKCTVCIHYFSVNWKQNPGGWPMHRVTIAGYNTSTNSQPTSVQQIDLSCNAGSGLWGAGNNVDGKDLRWGAWKTDGQLFDTRWVQQYGGNIPDCGGNSFDTSSGGEVFEPRIPSVRYHFSTNYGGGQPSADATVYIYIYAGSCVAFLQSGDGYIANDINGNSCTLSTP